MGTDAEAERIRRGLLFVPAVRPDRFPKALATGADAVCIDLEDGVAPGAKQAARQQALELLAAREPTAAEVSLRINDAKTPLGQTDLAALPGAAGRPDALMLPKVAGAGEIHAVDAALARGGGALPLIVQIETAAGLLAAAEIAAASPNVAAVFFGAIDLSADLGCAVEWEALLYARSRVLLAAAAAGVSALDSPFMDVPALDALAAETGRARRLGFAGKAAVHPTQVPVIQAAFAPDAAETAWARKVVAAYEGQQGGVLLVDGQLIELPVVRSARRTLRIADRLGPGAGPPPADPPPPAGQ